MSPSPATSTATATPPPQRDGHGRFAKGNRGGPGNPYARQAALIRQAAAQVVTEQDAIAIMHAMLIRAKSGDVAAARFVFGYAIGKPTEAPASSSATPSASPPLRPIPTA